MQREIALTALGSKPTFAANSPSVSYADKAAIARFNLNVRN
jgi:hypothetical protein